MPSEETGLQNQTSQNQQISNAESKTVYQSLKINNFEDSEKDQKIWVCAFNHIVEKSDLFDIVSDESVMAKIVGDR